MKLKPVNTNLICQIHIPYGDNTISGWGILLITITKNYLFDFNVAQVQPNLKI